jgi:predicted metal-binding membrane protein
MDEPSPLERLLKRDRMVVISALSLIIVTSWIYVLTGAGMGMSAFDMSSLTIALGELDPMAMDGDMPKAMAAISEEAASDDMGAAMSGAMKAAMATMATPVDWTFNYAVLMFLMWWIMMIAMMLPSAAPMILLHAMVDHKTKARAGKAGGPWPTASFTLGYLLTWSVFSLTAAVLQWAFEMAGLLSPMLMNSTSTVFAGAILVLAGIYQLTPIKQACLKHCRGPISFLSHHWRPGTGGALIMGVHHGAYCLGCCWGLMAILFFGGIMNLYWIIGLALIVLLEKLLPLGRGLSLVTGGLLLVWGTSFLYRTLP